MSQDRSDPSPLGVNSTDAELIQRAGAGEERAWWLLVERYKRLVYSIPSRYRLPDDACDDVFQNVFASVLRSLPGVRDAQSFPKWLITTTHRECWRWSRRNPSATPIDESVAGTSEDAPGEAAQRWETQQKVDVALQQLGGRCERLLRALFLDPTKPSYASIAERLGIPVGAIGPTRARCLAKLMEFLPDPR